MFSLLYVKKVYDCHEIHLTFYCKVLLKLVNGECTKTQFLILQYGYQNINLK